MSGYPPSGPPHYYGYPPPPGPPPAFAPGAYGYMPTPVMMPVYPPQEISTQPAFVDNYPPVPEPMPEPVHVVDNSRPEVVDWAPSNTTTAHTIIESAFFAGKEGWDGSPLFVIRAHHNGNLVPGKLAVVHRSAYIPFGGLEVPVHKFEVLCAPSHALRWVPSSNGNVPPGAVIAGNTHNAEPLYVGRVNHKRSETPGKIQPSHGCCYISFGGREIAYKHYEVLCRVDAF